MSSVSIDEADVLSANSAFYQAFAEQDIRSMETLWSRAAPVACIHPGWNMLVGREQVMASWRAILGQNEPVPITCSQATAHILGESAYVVCHERIQDARLVATNLFVREGGGWKMVHHQAAPFSQEIGAEQDEVPSGMLN